MVIFNGRKQNSELNHGIYITELSTCCKYLNLTSRRHTEMPYSSDTFSKIPLVCQAFRYPRIGNAASEIDTKRKMELEFISEK